MGLVPDGDAVHRARAGVEDIDDVVVAAAKPQLPSVGGDVAHVGAAARGDAPGRDDATVGEVHDADTAVSMRWTQAQLRPPAVADIQLGAITAHDQAVRTGSGADESGHHEPATIDQVEATAGEIRDVEGLAVRSDAHVLGNCRSAEPQRPDHPSLTPVDFDQAALELAGDDQVRTVDREVAVVHTSTVVQGERLLESERVWISELLPRSRCCRRA